MRGEIRASEKRIKNGLKNYSSYEVAGDSSAGQEIGLRERTLLIHLLVVGMIFLL